jgi:hypothetical protein
MRAVIVVPSVTVFSQCNISAAIWFGERYVALSAMRKIDGIFIKI